MNDNDIQAMQASKRELNRRSFLRSSVLAATGVAAQAQPMADQMSETFIPFARTGNPNNKLIPRWETYTLPRRQTMVFNVPSHIENDPRGAERRLFAKVPYLQPGT